MTCNGISGILLSTQYGKCLIGFEPRTRHSSSAKKNCLLFPQHYPSLKDYQLILDCLLAVTGTVAEVDCG